MKKFKQPLAVIFIWHPADNDIVKPIIEYCSRLLSRDIRRPFSRAMNLPLFYYTSIKGEKPVEIMIDSKEKIIFSFISKNIVADDEWVDYITNKDKLKDIIPIALESTALKIKELSMINHIRIEDYTTYINERVFIGIVQAIYRRIEGTDSPLRLFLSHTKDKNRGFSIAKQLKAYIDNSVLGNFFDVTDVLPGVSFENIIEKNIENATIIAIHSDTYSSRYWCQKEVTLAKEKERPIISVNCIKRFNDREVPIFSNIPTVRVELKEELDEKEILRIIITALVETIRFTYMKILLSSYVNINNTLICCRPPEILDLQRVLDINNKGKGVKVLNKKIIYPEPPVYDEEVNVFKKLNIKTGTPVMFHKCDLTEKKIGITIGYLIEEELVEIGQRDYHLKLLAQELARCLLGNGAQLIYGGDFRQGGVTEFLLEEAQRIQSRLEDKKCHLVNYMAWPIYKANQDMLVEWKAKGRGILKIVEVGYAEDVKQLIPNVEEYLEDNYTINKFIWCKCLSKMRYEMLKEKQIRICAGGKHTGYKGIMPGILEEVIIALENKYPIYLLGGFGGVTNSICKLICKSEDSKVEKLTLQWQIDNNKGYEELMNYIKVKEKEPRSYKEMREVIRNIDLEANGLHNGLSKKDNYRLFETPFIEEALYLILKGLRNLSS